MTQPMDPSASEHLERIVYALLRPSATVATSFGLALRGMGDLTQMACFHVLRREGLKSREIAERLDISMRKVAQLADRLKRNFLRPDQEVGLPRRIEFLLWAEPLSLARIRAALPDAESEAIDEAIGRLEEAGRISREKRPSTTVFVRNKSRARLVGEDLESRLDALDHLMANIARVVVDRFFHRDDAAFARTVSVQLRPRDLEELRKLYEETVYPRLNELEEAARGDADAVSVDVSLLWSSNPTP